MSDESITETEAAVRQALEAERAKRLRRTLVAALVVITALLVGTFLFLLNVFQPLGLGQVASSQAAGGVEWVRSIYGWGMGPEEQLSAPQSTAIGPDGVIWATDQLHGQIEGFRPDGSLLDIVHPEGDVSMRWVSSVAVDEAGLLYLGDMMGNKVCVLGLDGRIVNVIAVARPTALAVKGDRLVIGSASGFVIMNKTGNVIKLLGTSRGSADTQFEGIGGIAIGDDGTIYVVDQYNNRVSAYSTNGVRKWIKTTGAPGNKVSIAAGAPKSTAPAQMQLPSAIAIDGAGRLVIVDPLGFDLVVLNAKNGDFIGRYGDSGNQDGRFVYPSGVAYDSARDWFSVADTMNNRLQVVRIPGSGGSALASAQRGLDGPLRACLLPLAVLLLTLIGALVYRYLKRRKLVSVTTATDALDDHGPLV